MTPTNDDDMEGADSEFSLPSEIVKVPRLARVNMRQHASREIEIPGNNDAPEMDLGRYLHALRRNWLLGSILGILCSVPIAALMWKISPNEYTAVEYLRVSSTHVPLVFETMADQGARSEIRAYKMTQRQLMIQPYALSKALKKSEAASSPIIRELADPITWLTKQLKVNSGEEGEIMTVSLTLRDPVVAHQIVKSVVDIYMDDVIAKEKSERTDRAEKLEAILTETKDKVRKKLSDLSNTVEALGTGDSSNLNLAQQNVLQQFGFLRGELSKIKVDLMRLKGELEAKNVERNGLAAANSNVKPPAGDNSSEPAGDTKAGDTKAGDANAGDVKAADVPSIETSDPIAKILSPTEEPSENTDIFLQEALENDPIASGLIQQIERIKKTISQDAKKFDPKTAENYLKAHRLRLDEAKQKLASRTKRIQQLAASQGKVPSNRTEELETKISILEKQETQIREEMALLEIESKKFGRSSIDVEMKRKEISGLDPVVDRVSQEIERTKIEQQSSTRVTRFPSIGVPTNGENKKRLPMAAGGGLFGLLLPITLLVLLDSSRNHVNNLRTINDGLKLNVLGSVPRIPNRFMRRLNDPSDSISRTWRERITESISAVTSMLLRKLANEGHRVVIITSATSGEGKSTLSEQLGRSLADSGHRTLVIDFDLRRPNLQLRFDTPLEPGVTDVLRHGADLLQTVRQTDSPNLHLLTAGNCAGSLLLESANGTLEALFNQCRTEYELVLVDSSPLLPVVDGRLVGQHTDGAILTIVKDTSQVPQVLAARKILEDYEIPVLGCVFTGDKNEGYYGANSTYGSYGRLPSGAGIQERESLPPTNAM